MGNVQLGTGTIEMLFGLFILLLFALKTRFFTNIVSYVTTTMFTNITWHFTDKVKTIADSEDNIQGESLPPSGLNLSAQLF